MNIRRFDNVSFASFIVSDVVIICSFELTRLKKKKTFKIKIILEFFFNATIGTLSLLAM